MIFATVGTHEDPFDRLVEALDRLKGENRISQDVFIQTGYSQYQPQHCQYKDFISFQEMNQRMEEADIVITHGGTGSIMLVKYHNKIPIVVPRQGKFHEHIDDHQVIFSRTMENKGKILAVYDISQLNEIIANYTHLASELNKNDINPADSTQSLPQMEQRAAIFAKKIKNICLKLVEKNFVQ